MALKESISMSISYQPRYQLQMPNLVDRKLRFLNLGIIHRVVW